MQVDLPRVVAYSQPAVRGYHDPAEKLFASSYFQTMALERPYTTSPTIHLGSGFGGDCSPLSAVEKSATPPTIHLGSGFGGDLLPQGFVRGGSHRGLGSGFGFDVITGHGEFSSEKVQMIQERLTEKTRT